MNLGIDCVEDSSHTFRRSVCERLAVTASRRDDRPICRNVIGDRKPVMHSSLIDQFKMYETVVERVRNIVQPRDQAAWRRFVPCLSVDQQDDVVANFKCYFFDAVAGKLSWAVAGH